jgi:hypothetical protein
LALALAAFGLAEAFGVAAALLLAVADVLLSIDVLPLGVVDLLLSIEVLPAAVADVLLSIDVLPFFDAAGVLMPADVPVPALAALFLRHSLNAAPSMPLHGADEIEEAEGGVVAVLVADVVSVDCAPTTPAAANAVERSRARGLNRDWFITTSYDSEEHRSLNGPSSCPR